MASSRPTHAFFAALLLGNPPLAEALVHPSRHRLGPGHHRRQPTFSTGEIEIAGVRSPSTTAQHYMTPKHSPLEDEPWQKDESYWDQLQTASKDPEAFEKFIEESMERKKMGTVPSSVATNGAANGNGVADDDAPKKRGKYVPIEEWDESRKNGEGMTKEERIQWECQRSGNQFRQNEILRHHLNSF